MEGNQITPIGRVDPKEWRGAGDVVAAVAQPIAAAIDKIAGTDLVNCRGCKKRQETLNRLLPL